MKEKENVQQLDVLEGLRFALAFFLVCAISVAFLVGLNLLTWETAAAREEALWTERYRQVVPEAESFSDVLFDHTLVDNLQAGFSGSELKGYCVTVTSHGFGGEMRMLVGVDTTGRVTGVSILSHGETMELDPARQKSFLDQFLGRSGTIKVNGQTNSVDGVSGATMSSQAVADGVNAALAAVSRLGGGELGEEGTV